MPERETEEPVLREVIAEAKRLVVEQREALRRADFPALLAAAGGFHGLAARLATLAPDTVPSGSTDDLRKLRQEITRQSALIEKTIAATPRRAAVYHPRSAPPVESSLLIDRYA